MQDLLPDYLTVRDVLAATFFLLVWLGSDWLMDKSPLAARTTGAAMARYRMDWMLEMSRREMRMFDSALLGVLRNGVSFFASVVVLAIGGAVALMGQAEQLEIVARDLNTSLAGTRAEWEAKTLLVIFMLVNSFLKFAWANRIFGYCAIVMGATPDAVADPEGAERTAARAGSLNIAAGRSFNRGLRALYFALAALSWYLGPVALTVSTVLVAAMLYRREFRSNSRIAIIEE